MVPKSDKERDQAVAEAKEAAKAEFDKALDLVSFKILAEIYNRDWKWDGIKIPTDYLLASEPRISRRLRVWIFKIPILRPFFVQKSRNPRDQDRKCSRSEIFSKIKNKLRDRDFSCHRHIPKKATSDYNLSN